jgi:hypothetical protein
VSEENKAMVRRMVKAINANEIDVMDELFDPKLARPTKRSCTAFRAAFPTGAWRSRNWSPRRTRW